MLSRKRRHAIIRTEAGLSLTWLAMIVAFPLYAWQWVRDYVRHRRSVAKFRRLDPVQLAQVLIQVIGEDRVLRARLRSALRQTDGDPFRPLRGRR